MGGVRLVVFDGMGESGATRLGCCRKGAGVDRVRSLEVVVAV